MAFFGALDKVTRAVVDTATTTVKTAAGGQSVSAPIQNRQADRGLDKEIDKLSKPFETKDRTGVSRIRAVSLTNRNNKHLGAALDSYMARDGKNIDSAESIQKGFNAVRNEIYMINSEIAVLKKDIVSIQSNIIRHVDRIDQTVERMRREFDFERRRTAQILDLMRETNSLNSRGANQSQRSNPVTRVDSAPASSSGSISTALTALLGVSNAIGLLRLVLAPSSLAVLGIAATGYGLYKLRPQIQKFNEQNRADFNDAPDTRTGKDTRGRGTLDDRRMSREFGSKAPPGASDILRNRQRQQKQGKSEAKPEVISESRSIDRLGDKSDPLRGPDSLHGIGRTAVPRSFGQFRSPMGRSLTQADLDRDHVERDKARFMSYGQLPQGFEFLQGHMGTLGRPGAVAARGAMPLGGYSGGGGGYGGSYGGGGGYGGGRYYSGGGGSSGGYSGGGGSSGNRSGNYGGGGGNPGSVGSSRGAAPGAVNNNSFGSASEGRSSNLDGPGQPGYGVGGSSSADGMRGALKEQRAQFFAALDANPQLREKFMAIAANEQGTHAQGVRAVMEETINRAIVRGGGVEGGLKRLENEIRFTSEGGYYDDRHGGQGRAWSTARGNKDFFNKAYEDVRSGSNESNFGYGNASAGVARNKITGAGGIRAEPTRTINGETFFGPNSDEKLYLKRYNEWKGGLSERAKQLDTKSGTDYSRYGVGDYSDSRADIARRMEAAGFNTPNPTPSGAPAASAQSNAGNGNMLIMKGIKGQLDVGSAEAYARARGYNPVVMNESGENGPNNPQYRAAIERIQKGDVSALYGFSGGGYNAKRIYGAMTPEQRAKLSNITVVGSPGVTAKHFDGVKDITIRGDPKTGHMTGPRELAREFAPKETQTKTEGRKAVIALGTNDFSNPAKTAENVKSIIEKAKAQGLDPVIIPPNRSDPRFKGAYDEVVKAAKENGATIHEGAQYGSKDPLHVTQESAAKIREAYPGATHIGDSNSVRIGGQGPYNKVGAATGAIDKMMPAGAPRASGQQSSVATTLERSYNQGDIEGLKNRGVKYAEQQSSAEGKKILEQNGITAVGYHRGMGNPEWGEKQQTRDAVIDQIKNMPESHIHLDNMEKFGSGGMSYDDFKAITDAATAAGKTIIPKNPHLNDYLDRYMKERPDYKPPYVNAEDVGKMSQDQMSKLQALKDKGIEVKGIDWQNNVTGKDSQLNAFRQNVGPVTLMKGGGKQPAYEDRGANELGGAKPGVVSPAPPVSQRSIIGSAIKQAVEPPPAVGEGQAVTPIAGSPGVMNRVIEHPGGTRKLPLKEDLKNYLNYAAEKSGVYYETFSGGQTRTGRRTGSHRHDVDNPGTIGAADGRMYVIEDGKKRYLSTANPADRAQIENFTRTFASVAPSSGVGTNYMGKGAELGRRFHFGGGNFAGDRPIAYAGPDWFRKAHGEGAAQYGSDQAKAAYSEWLKAKQAGLPVGPPPPAPVAAKNQTNPNASFEQLEAASMMNMNADATSATLKSQFANNLNMQKNPAIVGAPMQQMPAVQVPQAPQVYQPQNNASGQQTPLDPKAQVAQTAQAQTPVPPGAFNQTPISGAQVPQADARPMSPAEQDAFNNANQEPQQQSADSQIAQNTAQVASDASTEPSQSSQPPSSSPDADSGGGPAAQPTPGGGTTPDAGSSDNGGAPDFGNHPESAAPEPGSGGSGSQGRCFV